MHPPLSCLRGIVKTFMYEVWTTDFGRNGGQAESGLTGLCMMTGTSVWDQHLLLYPTVKIIGMFMYVEPMAYFIIKFGMVQLGFHDYENLKHTYLVSRLKQSVYGC